jgi:hypothetical protein
MTVRSVLKFHISTRLPASSRHILSSFPFIAGRSSPRRAQSMKVWSNTTMARGWESKAIEAQQDEAARDKPTRPVLSDAQRAIEDKRRTLSLTRARALDDLSRAVNPRHRQMLEQTIAAIDTQLAELPR